MTKTARRALFAFVLGAGTLLTLTQVWAQLPAPPAAPGDEGPHGKPLHPPTAIPDVPEAPEPPNDFGGPGAGFGRGGGFGVGRPFSMGGRHRRHPFSEAEAKDFESLRQAIGKLKSAKNDAEKTALTKQISQLLDKSFERDLQRREKEISDVEVRIKKLRDQIEKRKKAKDDIISLRLKTIVNEADGLGFPEGATDARPGFGWQPDDFRRMTGMWVPANDADTVSPDAPKDESVPDHNESR